MCGEVFAEHVRVEACLPLQVVGRRLCLALVMTLLGWVRRVESVVRQDFR